MNIPHTGYSDDMAAPACKLRGRGAHERTQ